MVILGKYKDRDSLIIETPKLRAEFLKYDGGKMASLRSADGFEYLVQAPGDKYKVLSGDMRFGAGECSGFDDMFPTVDKYVLCGDQGMIEYRDHGEICRSEVESIADGENICFFHHSEDLGIDYHKVVSPHNDGIRLSYRIINRKNRQLPFIWAAHCMLNGSDNAEVISSYSENSSIVKMFGEIEIAGKLRTRLTGFRENVGAAYKFYYSERCRQGMCGYRYLDRNEAFVLRYDKEKLPYFGVWMNNGEAKGYYNIALEPATAPYDRPDLAGSEITVLPPLSEYLFDIDLSLE